MNRHDSPPGGHSASGRQDITDSATGGSRLLSRQCATCILRHGDPMHLGPERLRVIIGQALAAGSFVVCHDTLTYGDYSDYGPAICRGFFDAYAGKSPALILLRAYRRLVEVPPPEAASPGTAAGIDQAASGDGEVMPGRHDGGEEPGEHTCHRGPLCAAQEDDAREYDGGGGPGCDHFTCQEIVWEYGCAACYLAGASDGGPAAGPSTTTGPGSLAQVHTCPCGEVLEFGGDYGAPGTGQEWHCRNGHSWSRAGGRFADPSSGAHLLRPCDVR
jgi:hypothetical protein